MEQKIFISYSHKDVETVQRISGIIKDASSMSVWFDHNLRGGENYFSVIANQIIACDFFVFIVSDNSIASDWCLRELEFAASERKRIVAIWLDNITISPRIKLVIQNTHYINYYSSTDDSFFDAVTQTFQAGAMLTRDDLSPGSDQELTWSETYFLNRESLKKMEGMLAAEKKGKYNTCFQADHACLLGLAYELGIQVEPDPKKAEFYYKVSRHNGSWDGTYFHAAIRRKNDTAENAALYLPEMIAAAEHGSVYARTYLGDDYYFGRNGCEKDREKSYGLWKQAAADGGVVAMYYMAYGYRKGECFQQDADLAYMYALMAAEHGFARAYRLLAFLYEDGALGEQDYDKAIAMYEEAIQRGDTLSLCYQGWIYGQRKDYDKRRALYERAVQLADEGKTESGLPYYRLGYLYEYGEGVPKDLIKSVELYLTAAEKNNSSAKKYTVSTIRSIEDPQLQETYLKRAFDLGCDNAAYWLGDLEGKKTDPAHLNEAAIRYYTTGAENGDCYCVFPLLNRYSFVLGGGKTKEDKQCALRWFRFLFANATEELLQQLQREDNLSTYYYAYAIELDYDPELKQPDREFVQLYFKKCLDASPQHLARIAGFVIDGYLFPDESSSGLKVDVPHAEEMLKLVESYLDSYHDYIAKKQPERAAALWNNLTAMLQKGCKKIADCYASGDTVPKNKVTSKAYRQKAEDLAEAMRAKA